MRYLVGCRSSRTQGISLRRPWPITPLSPDPCSRFWRLKRYRRRGLHSGAVEMWMSSEANCGWWFQGCCFTRKHPETELVWGSWSAEVFSEGGWSHRNQLRLVSYGFVWNFRGKDFPIQGGFVGEHECFIVHISWMKFWELWRLLAVNVPNLRYFVSAPSSFIHRLLWTSEDLKFRS